MLSSGYEGVREIQKRLTNTMGWSATSGTVDNWVYDEANRCAAAGCLHNLLRAGLLYECAADNTSFIIEGPPLRLERVAGQGPTSSASKQGRILRFKRTLSCAFPSVQHLHRGPGDAAAADGRQPQLLPQAGCQLPGGAPHSQADRHITLAAGSAVTPVLHSPPLLRSPCRMSLPSAAPWAHRNGCGF